MDGEFMTISTTTSTTTIHSSGTTAGATAGAGDLGRLGTDPSGVGAILTLGAIGDGDQAGTTATTAGAVTTEATGTEDADSIAAPSPTATAVANAYAPALWLTEVTPAQAEAPSQVAQAHSAAVQPLPAPTAVPQQVAQLLQALP